MRWSRFETESRNWNAYPTNVTQRAAAHQAQVYDSRGNLLCSDTVHCGMFNSDEVYILTYRIPSEWGAALPSGRSFTADVTWPAEWAASLAQTANQETAAAFGDACAIDPDGMTHFELQEISEGRYAASCAFNPGAITNAVMPSITIHLNDNAWAVRDLNVGLSPVIIKEPAASSATAASVTAAESPAAETETPLPEIEIPMMVHPVTLTPSIIDADGTNLIYGSTLYVGED